MKPEHERLNKYIDDLQAGRHPEVGPAHDAEEMELFRRAAEWNALRSEADEPEPEFVRRLRSEMIDALGDRRANGGATGEQATHNAAIGAAPTPMPSASDKRPATNNNTRLEAVRTGPTGWALRRRQFIGAMGAAAAGLVAGFGFDRVLRDDSQITAYAEPSGQINPNQGKWFAVAKAADVRPGETITFNAGYVKGMLLHREDGFVGLSAVCTHLGCDIGWIPERKVLACGCHGSSFDTSGKPLTGPAIYKEPIRPLHSFQLKIEEGVVYVMA